MKKKLFVMSLVVTMLISITACGDTTPASTTPVESDGEVSPAPATDESTPDETIAPDVEDGIIDEGTLGDVPNVDDTSSIDTWNTDIDNGTRWEYGDSAWLETYPLVEDSTLARNLTYFVNSRGNSVSITWVGPNGMGGVGGVSPNGGTLTISDDNRNYGLYVFGIEKLSIEDGLLNDFDADYIMGWWMGNALTDTFKVMEDNDTTYSILFETTYEFDGISYRGYAYFVDYIDRMEESCYVYLIEESLFNEEDAMMVINSIEYFEGLVLNKYDNN